MQIRSDASAQKQLVGAVFSVFQFEKCLAVGKPETELVGTASFRFVFVLIDEHIKHNAFLTQ